MLLRCWKLKKEKSRKLLNKLEEEGKIDPDKRFMWKNIGIGV